MFSIKTYLEYLRNLQQVERRMISIVSELKAVIEDKNAVALLDEIREDERQHIAWEAEIIVLLEKNY